MKEKIFTPEESKEMIKGARKEKMDDDIRAGNLVLPEDNDGLGRPDDKIEAVNVDSKKPVARRIWPSPAKKRNAPGNLSTWHDNY